VKRANDEVLKILAKNKENRAEKHKGNDLKLNMYGEDSFGKSSDRINPSESQ